MSTKRRKRRKRRNDSAEKKQLDEKLAMAVQHHQRGDFQNAKLLYKNILETNPTHCQALGNPGLLAKQFKKFSASKKIFERVIDFPKNN